MKILQTFRFAFSTLLFSLLSLFLYAQEEAVDIKIDKVTTEESGGQWYMNPIVWVIGGAVFILLLVALLRSGKK